MKKEFALNDILPGVTEADVTDTKEALEKQYPVKPLPETLLGNGKCPRCGVAFIDKSTNYCGNCGQRLDWEV